MKLNLERFNLKQQKDLIFIILVFAITLFLGRKILVKQKENLVNVKGKIENYKEKIALTNEINKLSKEFDKFKKMAWQTKESVSVMGAINELANKYDIEIFSFDPGGLKGEGNYFTLSMALNIKADYFDLLRFLSAIEKLETLTKIINLRIMPMGGSGSGNEDGPKVQVNLTLRAFILEK